MNTIASDVAPTVTPSIGSGKASASAQATSRPATPAKVEPFGRSATNVTTAATVPAAPRYHDRQGPPRLGAQGAGPPTKRPPHAAEAAAVRSSVGDVLGAHTASGRRIPGSSMPRTETGEYNGAARRVASAVEDDDPVAAAFTSRVLPSRAPAASSAHL